MKNKKFTPRDIYIKNADDVLQNVYETYIRLTYLLPKKLKIITWITKKILSGNKGYQKNNILFRKKEALKMLYVGNKIFKWIKDINKEYSKVDTIRVDFKEKQIKVSAIINEEEKNNIFKY